MFNVVVDGCVLQIYVQRKIRTRLDLLSVYVVIFFIFTDRASTVPSNIRGCQSGTWSAGQKKIRGTSTKKAPTRAKKNITKLNRNDKKKGAITKYTTHARKR